MTIKVDFDRDWKFFYGEPPVNIRKNHASAYYAAKAGYQFNPAAKDFDDSEWTDVTLPHDYLVATPFSPENDMSHGYHAQENGWYRKSFVLPKEWEGKQIFLSFEGIAIASVIYCNGSIMARHNNAYIEANIDITDRVYFGDTPNNITVFVDGKSMSGWWYEGAGIYRHARLYVKDTLHIAHNGVYVCPKLVDGTENDFVTDVEVTLENIAYTPRDAVVRARLFDGEAPIGEAVAPASVPVSGTSICNLSLPTPSPRRWDVDDPYLYRAEIAVVDCEGNELDSVSVNYGYRTIAADADRGIILNGRPLKMKGVCNHQDHAGVGVAVPDAIQDYRVRALKEMGANAYRAAHNPPAKEILDACDRYGVLVMDEHRLFEASVEELFYLETMVRRDRNHPSVVFWSLFNEEPLQNTPEGAAIFRRQRALVEKLDRSRLILGAMNGNAEGAGQYMDAVGINYGLPVTTTAREKYPHLPILGTENCSPLSTRGGLETSPRGKIKSGTPVGYENDPQIMSDFDEEYPPWGSTVRECWRYTREREWHGGMFIWTGFDYRGEPTPFKYPSVSSQFGLMDTCGFPKNAYYFTKACYSDKPMLHIAPHWNFAIGDTVRVMTITNCDEVELFLNGVSLGRRKNDVTEQNEWQIAFEPGVLFAVGYRDGEMLICAERRTAGKAAMICLRADRDSLIGNGSDATTVRVSLMDENGNVLPTATDHVRFSITGGRILGTGNGNPNSHEDDTKPCRDLFAGHAAAIIAADASEADCVLTVTASVDGLADAILEIPVTGAGEPLGVLPCSGRYVTAFTASRASEDIPDYCRPIADNDMNSLIPISLGATGDTFTEGWRFYRAVIPALSAEKSDTALLTLELTPLAEVFAVALNGQEVYRAEHLYYKTAVRMSVPTGTDLDLRFLVKAWDHKPSGLGMQVKLTTV